MNVVERVQVGEILNRASFVLWDRMVEDGPFVIAYGWIGRDDGKMDFAAVVLALEGASSTDEPDPQIVLAFTSSSRWSKELMEALHELDELPDEKHLPCKRVEDELLEVRNKVELRR